MAHAKVRCRYCPEIRDKRGLTQHEMTHPEYTPRTTEAKMTKPSRVSRYSVEAPQRTVTSRPVAARATRTVKAAHRAMDTLFEEPAPEMPKAPPEIQAMLSGRTRVPREIMVDALEAFPTNPFLFSAFCYFTAPTETEVEQIINLKTCMQFIDLEIQRLGGWEGEEGENGGGGGS